MSLDLAGEEPKAQEIMGRRMALEGLASWSVQSLTSELLTSVRASFPRGKNWHERYCGEILLCERHFVTVKWQSSSEKQWQTLKLHANGFSIGPEICTYVITGRRAER